MKAGRCADLQDERILTPIVPVQARTRANWPKPVSKMTDYLLWLVNHDSKTALPRILQGDLGTKRYRQTFR